MPHGGEADERKTVAVDVEREQPWCRISSIGFACTWRVQRVIKDHMMPDPDAEPPIPEDKLIAQWRDHIGTPFPSEHTIKFELQQRMQLHFRGEENARAERHPEFAEYRSMNAQRLFEILRTTDLRAARLLVEATYLECRLLRLTGRFDECRQLCQSMPVYRWDYATLQEYIWATKRDDYPHQRFRLFKDEEDRAMVERFVRAARETYQEDLETWTARKDSENKPPPLTKAHTVLGVVTLGIPYVVAWSFYDSVGLLGAAAVYFVGIILMALILGALTAPFTSRPQTQHERVKEWERANPRPVCRISEGPDPVA